MGKSSTMKGKRGEQEVAAILRGYGYDVHRGGVDSYGSLPDVYGVPGLHFEIKRVERLNVPEAMKQSIRDSEIFSDGTPVLCHRRDREEWLVTLRLGDFMQIFQKSRDYE